MLLADLHTHTLHSHAKNSAREMLDAAWGKGLKIFGFSEHSPRPAQYAYPEDYQEKLEAGFAGYVAEVLELKKGCPEGRKVLLGLEVDFLPQELDFARGLCAAWPFDYVIGGLHFQKLWGFDYMQTDWDAMPPERRFAAYAQYYRDLADMCSCGLFNIAAHPDLIKIFSRESFTLWLETDEAVTLVRAALEAMARHGVAMEVSSAGLRKPCQEIYPGPKIMALAKDLNLPLVISSDAHNVNDVAYAFDRLEAYAGSFGYRSSLIFEGGRPVELPFA